MRIMGLSLAAIAVVGAVAVAARQTSAQLSLESVVDRVKGVNPTLRTFVVEQQVDVHVLYVFRWRIRTTLYAARPASYKIVVHNPPAVLARLGSVFSDISSPEKVLADYRATSIRPSGANKLILDLTAGRPGINPPSGTVIIETNRWLVEELVGHYDWGDVRAGYRYGQVGEFLLPISAEVTVPGFAIRARIIYSDYRLGVPLPPEFFTGAGEQP